MKKYCLAAITLVSLFLLFACSMSTMEVRGLAGLDVGETRTVKEGDIFFAQRVRPPAKTDKMSFDLTLLLLSDKEIILKMVEYVPLDEEKIKNNNGARWAPAPSVKTFTYPITKTTIRLQGLEFRILKVDGKKMSYRRLR